MYLKPAIECKEMNKSKCYHVNNMVDKGFNVVKVLLM